MRATIEGSSIQKQSGLQTAFVLIDPIPDQSIGCSLKIHRVEISVAGGKQEFVKVLLHRAASDILIASKQILRIRISSNDEYLQDSNIEELFTLRHNA